MPSGELAWCDSRQGRVSQKSREFVLSIRLDDDDNDDDDCLNLATSTFFICYIVLLLLNFRAY